MNTLLGSQFETSLRILILFEAAHEKPLKEEVIVMLDFINIYSRDFGIADSNLHGEGKYRFGEYASHRRLVKSAIKQLVLDSLIKVSQTPEGFVYTLNQNGLEFVSSLNSDYADDYYETALQVLITTREKSERQLCEIISRRALNSLEGG